MKIIIGNVGSTSLKTKIIDIDDRDAVTYLGEANLDRIGKRLEAAKLDRAKVHET